MSKNILNLVGFRCPETIMIIRKNMRNIKKKEQLLIITDDVASINDIPNFCKFMNHKVIKKEIKKLPYQYILEK